MFINICTQQRYLTILFKYKLVSSTIYIYRYMKWKCKAVVKFTFGFVLEKEYCSEHGIKKRRLNPHLFFFFFLPFYSFPVSLEAYDISSALGPLQDPLKGKKVLQLLLSLLLGLICKLVANVCIMKMSKLL